MEHFASNLYEVTNKKVASFDSGLEFRFALNFVEVLRVFKGKASKNQCPQNQKLSDKTPTHFQNKTKKGRNLLAPKKFIV